MDALDWMLHRAQDYADAQHLEAKLRIAKEETEGEIAASLLGNENPATNKPHSATSAKEAAKESPTIKQMRLEIMTAERETILAHARYEAALIAAWQTVHVVAGAA